MKKTEIKAESRGQMSASLWGHQGSFNSDATEPRDRLRTWGQHSASSQLLHWRVQTAFCLLSWGIPRNQTRIAGAEGTGGSSGQTAELGALWAWLARTQKHSKNQKNNRKVKAQKKPCFILLLSC